MEDTVRGVYVLLYQFRIVDFDLLGRRSDLEGVSCDGFNCVR